MNFRILALIAVLTSPAIALDRVAASLAEADVLAAMALAVAGDRVVLPAGTGTWTSAVSWNAPAGATLVGAGTAATGGGDQTIIQDNFASSSILLTINIGASGTFRMSGITVQSGTGTAPKANGMVTFYGSGATLRIDHCHFVATGWPSAPIILLGGGVFGVMDNCILDFTSTNCIYVVNGRNGAGSSGDYEWSLPTAFGGADYFFIEDCQVNGTASPGFAYDIRLFDGYTASKVVVRFNTLAQTVLAETHDTGHSGDDRGARSTEIYGNVCTSALVEAPNFTAVYIGSGTALVWGNSWNNVFKNIYRINVTRKNNATYSQSATPNGWGYAGTAHNGTGSNWDGGTYNATDTTLGYPCLDMPGRGQGQLLTGSFPSKTNSITGVISWPNQALEPLYYWNNSGGIVSGWGGAVDSNDTAGRAVADRDYYLPASGIQTNATTPFNGTTGTGWGTLANRPTTCTTGVAYWATDQGSWNTSTSNPYGVQLNGADGVLYKATATDTWTLYYTPYPYPHPLRGGATVATFAPRGGQRDLFLVK